MDNVFELEVANDLRRQASELVRQAEEIEKEISQNKANELVGKYFYDNNTYYKILKSSIFKNNLLCFSFFKDEDDFTISTDFEDVSISLINQMKEVKKEEVEKIFNELIKYSSQKLFE